MELEARATTLEKEVARLTGQARAAERETEAERNLRIKAQEAAAAREAALETKYTELLKARREGAGRVVSCGLWDVGVGHVGRRV